MDTDIPSTSKTGTVPDKTLARHGGVPRPPERPRGIVDSKNGEPLDSRLSHIQSEIRDIYSPPQRTPSEE